MSYHLFNGIQLRPMQAMVYHALRWLLDPKPRREGRTIVIAMAIIQTAIENSPEPVPLFDHYALDSRHESVRTTIRQLMRDMPWQTTFRNGAVWVERKDSQDADSTVTRELRKGQDA